MRDQQLRFISLFFALVLFMPTTLVWPQESPPAPGAVDTEPEESPEFAGEEAVPAEPPAAPSASPASGGGAEDFDFTNKNLEEQRREFDRKRKLSAQDIGLFFDPLENKVEFPPQIIDYDLTAGNSLRIGPLELPGQTIAMTLTRETQTESGLTSGLSTEPTTQVYALSFSWPLDYLPNGNLELIDEDNRIQWRKPLKDEEIWTWTARMDRERDEGRGLETKARNLQQEEFYRNLKKEWKSEDRKKAGSARTKAAYLARHWDSNFGLIGRDLLRTPLWQIKKPFRFCISQDSSDGRLAVCSRRYKLFRQSGRYALIASRRPVVPKVLVNDRPVTLKGSAIFVDDNSPIKFAALLSDGGYYEFVARPKPLNILDMTVDDQGQRVTVVGFGQPPLGEVEVVRRQSQDFWNFLNFMPTIGDFRDFWKAYFPVEEPYLYLRGYGGAPFKQNFYFQALPAERDRVYLKANSPASTYARKLPLEGRKAPPAKVESKQLKARNRGPEKFEWDFLAENRGVFNRSYITAKTKEHAWKAYYEVYKGYPLEISGRLTGVVSDAFAVILLGEAAAQYWFEDLFGWQNARLSKQRWGVSAKYFQTVAGFGGKPTEGAEGEEDSDPEVIKLAVINADLKYRLSPGVWGRDPSLGLMLSAQSVGIETFRSTMVGGGVFWARSMPKVFDDIFNWIPFLNYPKWVDMEFIFYGLAADGSSQVNANFAMNFHGKVQWTKRFFGEAGFGLKYFNFADLKAETNVGLGIGYGTIGVGYNF